MQQIVRVLMQAVAVETSFGSDVCCAYAYTLNYISFYICFLISYLYWLRSNTRNQYKYKT